MTANPLSQYFRQPAIYVRLPSGGRFYPRGTLESTANNEYGIMPMTTMDEITYRTPDALFNGQAVVSVIQSCVPNLRDAWAMPSIDVDSLLIAIRIATYGHEMDINTQCPSCSTEADYGVDLRKVLDSITPNGYDQPFRVGDLEITLKPLNYQQINNNSMTQFEDQKNLQALQASEVSDETKLQRLNEVLRKITTVTTRALTQSIAQVRTPEAVVVDPKHIEEWLSNCDRATFNHIRDEIIKAKQQGEIKPLDITCGNCGHKYQQAYTLDMANFFGDAS